MKTEWKNAGVLSTFQQENLGNILLGTPRSKWGNNTRMDLKEIGVNTNNSADSAQVRDYWRALVSSY